MITWGLVIVAMCFIHNVMFYVLRFLLGVAEAGFFPGVLLYFTQWLPDSSRGRASAIFLGGSATAYIVTGPITGALLELHGVGRLRRLALDVRPGGRLLDRGRASSPGSSSSPGSRTPAGSPGGEGRAERGGRPGQGGAAAAAPGVAAAG